MPANFNAMAISKEQVLKAQVITLAVVAYGLIDLIAMNAFAEYLYSDGLLVLVFLFLVPLGTVLVLLAIFLKKTFKPFPRRAKNAPSLAPVALEGLAGVYFPAGVDTLVAPRELRAELARLHGDLIAGKEDETLPRINEYLHRNPAPYLGGCGDVISKNLVKTDFYPDLIVIDGKTCRQGFENVFPSSYEHLDVSNVTGGVTRNAWQAIQSVMARGKRTIIEVNGGEEDLLLIPMVLLAPNNAIMAYGQPPVTDVEPAIPAGAVMVKVTPEVRKRFASIFSRFTPSAST